MELVTLLKELSMLNGIAGQEKRSFEICS
uniref:Endo-1,4-beta-glucanase homolog n=1 Tax=Candidatus Phytoplasma solani TaxID=69896 RepID=Q3LBT1_9MOLU|nr:endo-1,4-beta-glucanase homolog [Candidatus Phytoplasma solani]